MSGVLRARAHGAHVSCSASRLPGGVTDGSLLGDERGMRSGLEDSDGHGAPDSSPHPARLKNSTPCLQTALVPWGKASAAPYGVVPHGGQVPRPLHESPHPARSPSAKSPSTEQRQKGCRRKMGARGCSRTVPKPREHSTAAPQHPLALSHGDPRVGTPSAAASLAPRSPFPSWKEQKRFVAASGTELGQQTWPGHGDLPGLCITAGMGTATPHPTLHRGTPPNPSCSPKSTS